MHQAFQENTLLNHIFKSMDKIGCDVTPDFFSCRQCSRPVEGFYDQDVGIVLCENYQSTYPRLQSIMLHESIHAFDSCRAFIDPKNCSHVACTEIRANNLSGQCNWSNEFKRGNRTITQQHRRCVRRRALQSLQAIEGCQDSQEIIDRVWLPCYEDHEPFGFRPNSETLHE